MEELRKRYFERLNNFKETICYVSKELVNYRYGELYGLLDSIRLLNMISLDEYLSLMNELNKIYNDFIYKV